MIQAIKKLWLGSYARHAADAGIEPWPGWITGTGTDAETKTMIQRRTHWEALKQPRPMLWLDNLKVLLFPGNETSRVVFLTGLYEPSEFSRLAGVLKPGMTVIDIGANMGLYTMFAAKRIGPTGKVVALEPSKREFGRLETHVRLNGLGNVHCLQTAVGREVGTATLKVAEEWNAGHNTLGDFGYPETRLERTETVDIHTLDDLMESLNIKKVDIIKLDVEGAEEAVLDGAARTLANHRPKILVEMSERSLANQHSSVSRVATRLREAGYALHVFSIETGLPVPHEGELTVMTGFGSENIVALPMSS